jgi:hypothetical protein
MSVHCTKLHRLYPQGIDSYKNSSDRLQEASPVFEALSYVWGSPDDPSYVHIGITTLQESVVSTTRNLDIALRHLRYEQEERLIWIDALCIDQQNAAEKSKQVALMGNIYALASRVIVWLGPETVDSSKALNLMKELAYHVEVDWINSTFRPSSHSNEPAWAELGVLLPYRTGELNSVSALLERPYFERTWTRQEIALGRYAVVQCGRWQIPWKDLKVAIACVFRKAHYPDAIEPGHKFVFEEVSANAYDLCDFSERKCHYSEVRMSLRTTKCHDPRDRLYAVLSLLCNRDLRLNIRPDYSRTAEDIYIDVSKIMLHNDLLSIPIVLDWLSKGQTHSKKPAIDPTGIHDFIVVVLVSVPSWQLAKCFISSR